MKTHQQVNIVFEGATVKRIKRVGFQILGMGEETVGEHTFMTAVIAYMLGKQLGVDMQTVLTMSIFHDFHEARTGDVHKLQKEYVHRDQDKANSDIFAGIDDELLAMLTIYEEKKTLEAQVVYEANILALLVELKRFVEAGNPHAKEWFDANGERLRLKEAIALWDALTKTSSQNWWGSVRKKIHGKYKT